MLIRFGAQNFFGFKEGFNIDFSFGGNVPSSIPSKNNISYILGIKGANSSGKTNIIKALDFIAVFAKNPNHYGKENKIKIKNFYNNKESSDFYIEFRIKEYFYLYEFSIKDGCVECESLKRKIKKYITLYQREKNDVVVVHKTLKGIDEIKLSSNSSILSLSKMFKFTSEIESLNSVRMFFEHILTNVSLNGLMENMKDSLHFVSEGYYNDKRAFSFVKKIIIKSDSGIEDIEIKKITGENGEKKYIPFFVHKYCNKKYELSLFEESSGTRELYYYLGMYWAIIDNGGVCALDEFDMHLHSKILPLILELFENEDINKNGSQFLFTAHNTEIIDKLGKYRTVLVNKENNESYAYRLDEIKGNILRNNRAITDIYLDGKIGGIPNIDEND